MALTVVTVLPCWANEDLGGNRKKGCKDSGRIQGSGEMRGVHHSLLLERAHGEC